MKRKLILIMSLILVFGIVLSGCGPNNGTNGDIQGRLEAKDKRIAELEEEIDDLKSQLDGSHQGRTDNLLFRVVEIINSIKDKDFNKLSTFVHPSKGLRFSPYDYIDTETSKVFTVEEVKGLVDDEQVYLWGHYDGTGDPIELNFNEYYERFIYDADFANPQVIGNNVAVSYGNAIDNSKEVYPDSHFIELHFKGLDPKYEGMDWRSLKLIFEQEDGEWYLVAIVHGEWTI
ncbi:MAG: hypothetical protein GX021_07825 [Tissierellia bacterium]|nr:hypothetical protein [Tissierellia bacterium]